LRAILIGAAPVTDRAQKKLLKELQIRADDNFIGVDGGTDTLGRLGIRPRLAVGDWDSLGGKRAPADFAHITLPRGKSRSDLFYAVVAAIEAGADDIVCLGVTGGRLDHHLAMLYDLSNFSSGEFGVLRSLRALGPEGEYHFLSPKMPQWRGTYPIGTTVSVFAMKGAARGVTLRGFQFNLKNALLEPSSHGLSNEIKKRICDVTLRKGQLLLIMLRGGAT
jgi:thiamine pyrophosphokinase